MTFRTIFDFQDRRWVQASDASYGWLYKFDNYYVPVIADDDTLGIW